MDSIVGDALDDDDVESSADADGGGQTQRQSQQNAQTQTQQQPTGGQPASNDDVYSSDSAPNTNPNSGKMTDDDLRNVLDDLQTEITVVGCGGGGNNTVNRMAEEGITGADLVAVNTDVQHLLEVEADEKILIGKEKTQGRGAGSKPQVGEESALETQHEIQDSISGSDMVFVTAGMGGGTGTGAAPVVAQAAQQEGALTISIVTTPFTAEGEIRRQNADAGLERLREVSDTVIVVPNDRLLDTVGQMPIKRAFRVADEVLMRSVKGITELITQPGLVNLDFADVTTIMENGGVALIGLGESDSERRAEDSVKSALRSPLLDVDISGADSVLVNVTGGNDMAIEEAEGVVEEIHDRVDPDARIIWGTSVDEELGDSLRTMLVVTGVDSPQMYGNVDKQPTRNGQQPKQTGGNGSSDVSPQTSQQQSGNTGVGGAADAGATADNAESSGGDDIDFID